MQRNLIERRHQEEIIVFCEKLGIKITAFYLFALENDTPETVEETLKYALKVNTAMARFAIATPYPGTGFYSQLEAQDRIITKDYESYTQFQLVYKHKNLSNDQVKAIIDRAYLKYYFRFSFFFRFVKWKIRELWL